MQSDEKKPLAADVATPQEATRPTPPQDSGVFKLPPRPADDAHAQVNPTAAAPAPVASAPPPIASNPSHDSGVFKLAARTVESVQVQLPAQPKPPTVEPKPPAPRASTPDPRPQAPEVGIALPAAREAAIGLPPLPGSGTTGSSGANAASAEPGSPGSAKVSEGTRHVSVSARKLDFPKTCPCCLGDPGGHKYEAKHIRERGKRITKTSATVWEFPYCRKCLDHAKADRRTGQRLRVDLVVYAVLLFALGCWYWQTSWLLAPIGAGIGAATAVGVYFVRMRGVKSGMTAGCACSAFAVDYTGFEGTVHHFRFNHSAYAEEFARLNSRKVVD